MSAASWAAAYRSLRALYDNETDLARAVVREHITRAIESRTYDNDIRAQVSVLWAEDWDCNEDAVYDEDGVY